MEPAQLQLVLNVITITGVTTMAGYCFLLKKENRKLAAERKADSRGEARCTEAVQTVVSEKPVTTVEPVTTLQPVPTVEQDIRTFASARRTRWVKGLASSIS